MTVQNIRFAVRRRLAADWTSLNEVLLLGEIGLERNTRKFKFGDGVTPWNSLPYYGDGTYQPADSILTELSDLSDPNGPRLLMWEEDSAGGGFEWVTVGTGLALVGNTLTATGGGGGGGSGSIRSYAYSEVVGAANTSGSTAIPYDNTAPTITEGDPLSGFNVSHAATDAASKLRIKLTIPMFCSTSNGTTGFTLWRGSTLICSAFGAPGAAGTTQPMTMNRVITAGTTASQAFTVRAGGNVAATIRINTDGTSNWGSTVVSSLDITEFAP